MIHYNQADPRWGQRIMGRNSTLKQAGCAVTCIAMVASEAAGREITPALIDSYLDKHKGYVGDSLVWDQAVAAIKAFGGDSIGEWHHVKPESYDPATCQFAIFRVYTKRKTFHYVVDLKDGQINDPGHKNGQNTTLRDEGYVLDRVTIFC